jgi:hypothetical protein
MARQAHSKLSDKKVLELLSCLFKLTEAGHNSGCTASSLGLDTRTLDIIENDPELKKLIVVKHGRRARVLTITPGYVDIVKNKINQLQQQMHPAVSVLAPVVQQLPLCLPEGRIHKRILSALFTPSSKQNTPEEAESWAQQKGLEIRSHALVFIRCQQVLRIEQRDGNIFHINPSEHINKELILNDAALDSISSIRLANTEACTLITVENFAAFQHLPLELNEIALHQPGFDDRYTAVVLQKLKPAQVFHCGDLDLQGIHIAKRLAEVLSVPFYLMVPKKSWLKLLTEHFAIPIAKHSADSNKKGQKSWPVAITPAALNHYLAELIASERWLEQETFILFQRQELDLLPLQQVS